jgi:uncharacterized protein YggE
MHDTWQSLSSDTTIRRSAVGVLVVLGLFLLVLTLGGLKALGHATPATNVITVTGTGKAAAVPDTAEVTFTVQESAPAVADAQTKATNRTNDALAAMKKDGIADKDVTTLSYNITPQYDTTVSPCPPGVYCTQSVNRNKIVGYEVTETIQVKVRDTGDVGQVLQDLGSLGVQNVSGPDFVLDDPHAVTNEARANAIADAKAQAELLAKQLGVHLGTVVSYSENGATPYPMYKTMSVSAGYAEDQAAPLPSLPNGEQETSVNVSVTYEIN